MAIPSAGNDRLTEVTQHRSAWSVVGTKATDNTKTVLPISLRELVDPHTEADFKALAKPGHNARPIASWLPRFGVHGVRLLGDCHDHGNVVHGCVATRRPR